jgi:hypothetical protein
VKLVPANSLRPSAYNPRAIDDARLGLLELSLRKLGFVLPLYADADGEILSGHQRHLVATERLRLEQLPADFTKPMPLAERKAVNIAFNRGTNDFTASTTPGSAAADLAEADPVALAAGLPDLSGPDLFPCLRAESVPVRKLTVANAGRWVNYARNVAATLAGKGIDMPVVATRDLAVLNGIGRVQYAAERKRESLPVVFVTDQQAAFARAMLNLLSGDFDIHTRYADLLRYNSFRRPRGHRTHLGRGFTFDLLGRTPSKTFDITRPADLARWRRHYGRTVCDFGAGLLDETRLLQSVGIDCVPFEPYLLDENRAVSPDRARALAREFLARVADGTRFDAVFLASVLNSVPFARDRRHIATIVAALCGRRTAVHACASSRKQTGWKLASGRNYLNRTDAQRIQFRLGYEPGTTIGDFSAAPKVQKHHTAREFHDLWAERFEHVVVTESSNNVNAVCRRPRPIPPEDLAAALRFEFDLPYPDGSTMGLVAEAMEAFAVTQ